MAIKTIRPTARIVVFYLSNINPQRHNRVLHDVLKQLMRYKAFQCKIN